MVTTKAKPQKKQAPPVQVIAKQSAPPSTQAADQLLAAVRIRGDIGVRKPIQDTMFMMRLYHKNFCIIMQDTAVNRGMLAKAKDFITYGEVSADTLQLLAQKRKKESCSSAAFKVFRLNSPRKGYGRKGVKKTFVVGGALGYRKEHINDLLKRMM